MEYTKESLKIMADAMSDEHPELSGKTKEQTVNLCDTCEKHIATCDGNPKFGTGKGNDNVYECDRYMKGGEG